MSNPKRGPDVPGLGRDYRKPAKKKPVLRVPKSPLAPAFRKGKPSKRKGV
jgi:hypothetical protein